MDYLFAVWVLSSANSKFCLPCGFNRYKGMMIEMNKNIESKSWEQMETEKWDKQMDNRQQLVDWPHSFLKWETGRRDEINLLWGRDAEWLTNEIQSTLIQRLTACFPCDWRKVIWQQHTLAHHYIHSLHSLCVLEVYPWAATLLHFPVFSFHSVHGRSWMTMSRGNVVCVHTHAIFL